MGMHTPPDVLMVQAEPATDTMVLCVVSVATLSGLDSGVG
jgi:hypothetical protein